MQDTSKWLIWIKRESSDHQTQRPKVDLSSRRLLSAIHHDGGGHAGTANPSRLKGPFDSLPGGPWGSRYEISSTGTKKYDGTEYEVRISLGVLGLKTACAAGSVHPHSFPPLKGNGPAWLACYEKSQYEFLNLKNVTSHKPQTPCEVFVLGTSYICHAYFSGTPASHCDWEATGWRSLTGSVVADIE